MRKYMLIITTLLSFGCDTEEPKTDMAPIEDGLEDLDHEALAAWQKQGEPEEEQVELRGLQEMGPTVQEQQVNETGLIWCGYYNCWCLGVKDCKSPEWLAISSGQQEKCGNIACKVPRQD